MFPCAGCGISIVNKYFLSALDLKWHLTCLKCCVCFKSLDNENSCYCKDGQVYCKQDYYKIHWRAKFLTSTSYTDYRCQSCSSCHAIIFPDELVMRARHLVYHLECFKCQLCRADLNPGDPFGLKEELLVCQNHFMVHGPPRLEEKVHFEDESKENTGNIGNIYQTPWVAKTYEDKQISLEGGEERVTQSFLKNTFLTQNVSDSPFLDVMDHNPIISEDYKLNNLKSDKKYKHKEVIQSHTKGRPRKKKVTTTVANVKTFQRKDKRERSKCQSLKSENEENNETKGDPIGKVIINAASPLSSLSKKFERNSNYTDYKEHSPSPYFDKMKCRKGGFEQRQLAVIDSYLNDKESLEDGINDNCEMLNIDSSSEPANVNDFYSPHLRASHAAHSSQSFEDIQSHADGGVNQKELLLYEMSERRANYHYTELTSDSPYSDLLKKTKNNDSTPGSSLNHSSDLSPNSSLIELNNRLNHQFYHSLHPSFMGLPPHLNAASHAHHHHIRSKRLRTSFKHHQLKTMKTYFALNHNPDAKDLKQLSQKTGLSKRVLQVWFQNARAKYRRNMSKQEGSSYNNGGDSVSGCSNREDDSPTLEIMSIPTTEERSDMISISNLGYYDNINMYTKEDLDIYPNHPK
ncbi:unnamed protein product [Gordionus sp. m RMFG-2023]